MKKTWMLLLLLILMTACGDPRTPDEFSFPSKTDVPLSTVIESDPARITGNQYGPEISIVNGEYSIDGGAYTSDKGKIRENQTVKVRHTSSDRYSTQTVTTLRIFNTSRDFVSVTIPEPPPAATNTAANSVTADPTGKIQIQSIAPVEMFRDSAGVTFGFKLTIKNTGTARANVTITWQAQSADGKVLMENKLQQGFDAGGPFTYTASPYVLAPSQYDAAKWAVTSVVVN